MVYNQQHKFYCGVDLHARSMFTHVLDAKGKTVFEDDLPAGPDEFLRAIKPFRKDVVVGCECMFAWYWLADLCFIVVSCQLSVVSCQLLSCWLFTDN